MNIYIYLRTCIYTSCYISPDTQRVLHRDDLSLEGAELTVTNVMVQDTTPKRTYKPVSPHRSPPPAMSHPTASRNMVTVSGIKGTTKEDLLRMFFQSKKRSGGGPVKDIHYRPTEGQATITLDSEEGTHRLNNNLHPWSITPTSTVCDLDKSV